MFATLVQLGRRLLASEPAVTLSLVGAVLALAVSFGLHIDNAQIDAIKNVVGDLLIFAATVAGIRQSVTPVS